MATKPSIVALSRDAKDFVGNNRAMLQHYAVPVVAPLLVCNFIASVGVLYSKFALLMFLPSLYFGGAFILAWHRAVLLGVRPQHAVNPFVLKPGEGKFILTLIGIAFVPFLFGLVGGVPVGAAMVTQHKSLAAVFGVLCVPLMIYAVIVSLRLAFMLPARSVNVNMTVAETKAVSRGLKWTLFASTFLAMILPALLAGVIRAIASLLVEKVLGFPVTAPLGATLVFILGGVPAVLINFIIYARYVTILSRLYQWSVQNRPANDLKSAAA